MPNLREYISVGFCGGYNDGDYRVSMAVADLSRERFNELQLAVLGALRCADDIWKRENVKPDEKAAQVESQQ